MKSLFQKKSIQTALLVLLALLCLAFIVNEARGNGDFAIFLEAAKALASKGDLYNTWFDIGNGASGLYYYSPLFALLLVPFSYLPNFIPNLIWLLLNVYFVFRIWDLIKRYFNLQSFGRRGINLLFILTLLFTLRFIHINFAMIQMTIYILWSMLESLHFFKRKQDFKGALILALAINIKILPMVLIPYLIYRGLLKPVLLTIGFFIVYLVLPAIILGFDYNSTLLAEWWNQVNPLNSSQLIESTMGIHSLTALLPSLLHETNGAIEFKRHIVNLDLKYVTIIMNSVRLALILLTIYFLRTLPFKPVRSKSHEIWELSYIFLIIPLIFPHQQKYAFVLILPAAAYIFYFLIFLNMSEIQEYRKRKWKLVFVLLLLSFFLSTLTSDLIVGKTFNHITQHYKTITYGTIILLIVLAMCNPKYIDPQKKSENYPSESN